MSSADEVNKVVEKVAEVTGRAVEASKPLAERVIQEYAVANWVLAGLLLMGMGALYLLCRAWSCSADQWRRENLIGKEGWAVNKTLLFVAMGVGLLLLTVGFVCSVYCALTPTYQLLKELTQ